MYADGRAVQAGVLTVGFSFERGEFSNKTKQGKLEQIIVIMFSSLVSKQMIFRCKGVGADNYITKPEMDKLVAMLDELCLKGKTPSH